MTSNQSPADQIPDTVENSFLLFKDWLESHNASGASPKDALGVVVVPIINKCLGWELTGLASSDLVTPPYECIMLCANTLSRVAVLYTPNDLGISKRNADRPYPLDGAVLGTSVSDARLPILEACKVCGLKNCELACVSNGKEWIVFRGTRLADGRDTLSGMAYLFEDLDTVKNNYKLFFDLLAPDSVQELRFRAIFQEAEGQPIRASVFSKVLRTEHQLSPLPRSKLAVDLDRVMDSFFQRLLGDKDPDMLANCFVVTKESDIAEQKIARISEELVAKIKPFDTRSAETLSDIIHKVKETKHNEFVLLVGTKGAGKSTFIDRFFRNVLPTDIRNECIVVQVDMKNSSGNEATLAKWLDDTVLALVEEAVFKDVDMGFNDIQGMFFDEYLRLSKTTLSYIYKSDKDRFKEEFGRHVERMRVDRPHDYIQRLMRHIVNNRKKAPCLVFDNADHFSIEFQERVFQYARSIYETTVCLVIMPITDKTSWQLSRQGALQSFESVVSLFLPTPLPKTVLARRIKYLEDKVADEDEERGRGYFLGQGIQLELTQLKAFAHCLQHVFLETGKVSKWVGNLSNLDIRRSLELTRSIMASPYIDVDDLLGVFIAEHSAPIPIHKIQRAIIRKGYNFFPVGQHQFVQNIFSLRTEIGTSPLLGIRILAALHDNIHTEIQGAEGFLAVSQLYDYFQATTIERRVVSLWLDAMLKSGLCLSYDPTHTSIEEVKRIEISPAGRQHLFWGTADDSYVGSMMEVTPINDHGSFEKMNNAPRQNKTLEWLYKTDAFIRYILDEDDHFVQIPDHDAYIGQLKLRSRLIRMGRNISTQLDDAQKRQDWFERKKKDDRARPGRFRDSGPNGSFRGQRSNYRDRY